MYAERESMKVSMMIWKLSSFMIWGPSRRISVATTLSGEESKARRPR